MKNLRAISLSIVMAVAAATAFATSSMADDGITNDGYNGTPDCSSSAWCTFQDIYGD